LNIVERVKNICLTPSAEWPVIAEETTPTGELIAGYVLPLSAIGAIAGFIGAYIIGTTIPFVGYYRSSLTLAIAGACIGIVTAIIGVFIASVVINGLAPTFGAQKDNAQALKVAVYSFTPGWVAGVLRIVPLMGVLAFFAALYGIYLLYLGLPRLMKCPQDKAVGYTAVVVVCTIVVSIILGTVGAAVVGVGAIGAGGLSSLTNGVNNTSNTSGLQVDPNSPLGKLKSMGDKLEESSKKMEAAQKTGDANAQASAALEGLGQLLGGGKRYEPVGIDELKAFVPETLAGLPRTSKNTEKSGVGGFMVSKGEATYSDGAQKQLSLEVTDTGGMSGLMGLASWMAIQGERESDDGSERTRKEGNRLVHEKISKSGSNEYAVVLGDRFMVTASSRDLNVSQLKAAVSSINLDKLESMKESGGQK
jgi:Yip1 domain